MKKNFKIIVEYDGTDFFGWQRQNDKKTIQGELEKALSMILNQDVRISGSGRTDAGVHAFGQVANFHVNTGILPQNIKKGVNSVIKQPIVIRECQIVDNDFHGRYKAVSKEYHYFILNREDPCAIGRSYQWHIRHPLDIEAMNQCCNEITGVFDFKSFENTGSPRSSTIREIFFSHISVLDNNRLVFKICGSGFLKYMVRNLIGTIVLAGLNKITVTQFRKILETKDRTKAGPTAPAHGLFLKKVNYS
ncbi:tRNA pseudouridine(38-40) synthase TruA [Desulfobacula toluolica]|uniref:tRNA pseudouridine synthase A n=1 Tax=Desulfobacula toluolica (strain DSM 7467 / Tol2) TaxID=651182 RepID=K0NH67_DESTT|nr:tRNA pseudouridine(38-40) synthase TruA [Desulfobacula toluolica]CCK80571.1 TruA2: tRNA pseudouridine synthase A [Desulfobacula toluolica Tol2]